MVTTGKGMIRGTVTVNSGATLDWAGANALGWNDANAVSVLNINGGTVGGADFQTHFWQDNGTFTLNMTGGELKLGGGTVNPTRTTAFNVLSSSNQAKVTAVSAGSSLALDGTATFNVADGSQDVDLLVSANLSTRYAGTGQLMKTGAGTMRMPGANS